MDMMVFLVVEEGRERFVPVPDGINAEELLELIRKNLYGTTVLTEITKEDVTNET